MRQENRTPEPDFEQAIEQAAALLRASTLPVVAGLCTDVAGAVAALRLAALAGGVIDHAAAESCLCEQAVLQDSGLMFINPGEARRRADTYLLVGDGPLRAWPELADFLWGKNTGDLSGAALTRRVLALSSRAPEVSDGIAMDSQGCAPDVLPDHIAALRARVNGRPLAADFDHAEIERLAEALKTARFGVAVWSPDELGALAMEMLVGLIKDLNAETRWSGVSVSEDATAAGAMAACGWMTGLPFRTGLARGHAEHDTWRFDARRLVQSGEADAVLWISALAASPPQWLDDVPTVLLAEPWMLPSASARVKLAVGRPGVDHDSVLYDRRSATLAQVAATAPSTAHSVADVLARITGKLASS